MILKIKGENLNPSYRFTYPRAPSISFRQRNFEDGKGTVDRHNNLDFVRIMAAMMVLYGHQFVLFGQQAPGALGSSIHTLGVKIFFALSGYLIARSWDYDPNLKRFLAKRALRIMPALILVVLLSVFILGPVMTDLPIGEYLSHRATYDYLTNILLEIRYSLPGVFVDLPVPVAVNGSLWTLPVEVAAYSAVLVIGIVSWGRWRGWLTVCALVLGCWLNQRWVGIPMDELPIIYGTSLQAGLAVSVYFLSGAVLWHLRAILPLRTEVGILCVIAVLALPVEWIPALGSFPFAYAVLAFGLSRTPVLADVGRVGDLSYGSYLVAFPIQQITATYFPVDHMWFAMGIAMVATVTLAALSWHLLEKRCLALKPAGGPSPR